MNDDAPLSEKERERAALSEEAAGIVRTASARGKALTADEDSQVLALMTRVRVLEEEIKHLRGTLAGGRTRDDNGPGELTRPIPEFAAVDPSVD